MVVVRENDDLIHEAPAIVGCRMLSALARGSRTSSKLETVREHNRSPGCTVMLYDFTWRLGIHRAMPTLSPRPAQTAAMSKEKSMRLPLPLILFLPAIGTAESLRIVDPPAPSYTENLHEVAQILVEALEP